MTDSRELNAAQIQQAQKYAAEIIERMNMRKWAMESALASAGANAKPGEVVDLARAIYEFVTAATEPTAPAPRQ